MADDFVQLAPDSTGKKIDNESLTIGANLVFRQRVQVAGAAPLEIARVISVAPVGTEFGLVTRPILQDDTVGVRTSLNALNAAATVSVVGHAAVGFFLEAGTFIGTIVPEYSPDGVLFGASNIKNADGSEQGSMVFAAANGAFAGSIITFPASATTVRMRVSAFTSGAAFMTLRATRIDKSVSDPASAPDSTFTPIETLLVGGREPGAGFIRTFVARLVTPVAADPALVVANSPNSAPLTVAQGAPAGIANRWPVQMSDGVSSVAVKAASTAPVAADPSEVVALSPNLPAWPAAAQGASGLPVQPWGMTDSLAQGGSAAAPAAAAAIATLAAPPAGTYRVKISVAIGGAIAAADIGNMQAQKAGAAFLTGLGAQGGYEIEIPRMNLDGATAVSVNAIAAATAGTQYAAAITATRIF